MYVGVYVRDNVLYHKLHLLDNITIVKYRQGMSNIQFTQTDLDLIIYENIIRTNSHENFHNKR